MSSSGRTTRKTHAWERSWRSQRRRKSGWLSPVEIDERLGPIGADVDPGGRRASRKGFLAISLTRYLELLDWTGRQICAGKSGAIPQHLTPFSLAWGWMVRAGVTWSFDATKYSCLFHRA